MKKDLLRIYVLIFMAFMFISSVKFMYELLSSIPFIPDQILLALIIALHIGSGLLILSGRLKD